MQCPECQTENPDTRKICREGGADGWLEIYEKELAAISL